MVQVEETLYGYRITFPPQPEEDGLQNWIRQSRRLLDKRKEPFRAVFDLRNTTSLSGRARLLWDVGMNLYKHRGMDEAIVLWPDGHLDDIHPAGDGHFLDKTA